MTNVASKINRKGNEEQNMLLEGKFAHKISIRCLKSRSTKSQAAKKTNRPDRMSYPSDGQNALSSEEPPWDLKVCHAALHQAKHAHINQAAQQATINHEGSRDADLGRYHVGCWRHARQEAVR